MPDAKVTFPTVVVPARRLAAQWLAVFNAAGNNKTEFTTYRAVAVEFFPDQGVRLVAMNEGHTLILRAFVPCWHLIDSDGDAFYDEPPPDEAPIRTIIVRDINRRVVTNHGTVHGVLAPMQREQVAEQEVDDETRRQLTAEVEEFARFAAELPADPDFDDEPDVRAPPAVDLPRGTFNPDDPDDDEAGSFLDELDDGP